MADLSAKTVVGWREVISLPEIKLNNICAKIDTGAKSCALHATDIHQYSENGQNFVRFLFDHKSCLSKEPSRVIVLPIKDLRKIKNTSGVPQARIVVATPMRIASVEKIIDISLCDRANMKYPIIIGRTALQKCNLSVEPSESWLQSIHPGA